MPIITLTTDLGTKDFYLAAVKATLIKMLPTVQLIDISNEITPYDVSEAAYFLKNAYSYFPEGTVHLFHINYYDFNEKIKLKCVLFNGHYFVGPDNGIMSIITEGKPEKNVDIKLSDLSDYVHFPLINVLAKAACHLANGGSMDVIGVKSVSLLEKKSLESTLENGRLRGYVLHVDRYENAITSITRDQFEKYRAGRNFRIILKADVTIETISLNYTEEFPGNIVALFSITGNLEISISHGKASSLLGLRKMDNFWIEFF